MNPHTVSGQRETGNGQRALEADANGILSVVAGVNVDSGDDNNGRVQRGTATVPTAQKQTVALRF